MKAKLIRDMPAAEDAPEDRVTDVDGVRTCPSGLVFEHPDSFWQVLMGNAVAEDDECKAEVARRRTKPQLEVARQAMDELLEIESDGQAEDLFDEEDDNEGDDE
jgi:hypothetical protein